MIGMMGLDRKFIRTFGVSSPTYPEMSEPAGIIEQEDEKNDHSEMITSPGIGI
jgi:hypothetical protein